MQLLVCGLSAGLTLGDMRPMRQIDVANIVSEAAQLKGGDDGVRDATQEDIEMLKRF